MNTTPHHHDGSQPFVDQRAARSGEGVPDASELCADVARRWRTQERGTDLWEDVGYEVVGPLYLSFVTWVVRRAVEDGVTGVFFPPCHGFYLHKTFEMLAAKCALELPGTYMLASRQLVRAALATRSQGSGTDAAHAERQTLLQYLDSIGFLPRSCAIATLGWQASAVRSLVQLVSLGGSDARLRGYCFATWPSAQTAIDDGCAIDSFFCHLGEPSDRYDLLRECPELVEHFCEAPHAPIAGLRRRAEGWTPLYGPAGMSDRMISCAKRMCVAGLRFVDDILDAVDNPLDLPPPFSYLETVLGRILRTPTPEEARTFGALPSRTSSGAHASSGHLAKPPPAWLRRLLPALLRHPFKHCCWSSGYLAQLSIDERERLSR